MLRICLIVFAQALAVTSAWAVDRQLVLTNHAGETLTAVKFAPAAKPDQPLPLAVSLPLAANATVMATVSMPDSACVFNATYTFASGQTTAQPDIDLCQLDGIVVE